MEALVIAALALNGILCTAALVWLLRRAGMRRDLEWDAAADSLNPPELAPPGFELEPPERYLSVERYPSRVIVEIMAEHYPVAYERFRSGHMERAERLQVWDACCAIHDARFEIEELCS